MYILYIENIHYIYTDYKTMLSLFIRLKSNEWANEHAIGALLHNLEAWVGRE